MSGHCLGEATRPLLREPGMKSATVARTWLARDEAVQAIDEPGDAALTQEDARGELAHPHPPVGSVVEPKEHLELAQRQPVGRLELAVELPQECRVDAEEPSPRRNLELRKLIHRRPWHVPPPRLLVQPADKRLPQRVLMPRSSEGVNPPTGRAASRRARPARRAPRSP